MLTKLYRILQMVVNDLSKAIFSYPQTVKHCENLSFEILSQCNFHSNPSIRSKATSLFYILLMVTAFLLLDT